MRNIPARIASIVIIIAALAPCAAFTANAAYDYYWFGTAGDGLWTTPANWSSTPDSYTAVANGYPRSSIFNVHIDTSVAADHHVTINIPKLASNPPQCAVLEIFDSTDSATGPKSRQAITRISLPASRSRLWA